MSLDPSLRPYLKTMQIIALALMVGVATCLIVMSILSLSDQPGPLQGQTPIISMMSFAALAIGIAAGRIVSNNIVNAGLRTVAANDMGRLLAVKQTAMIVSFALLEGPAFMGCIALYLERQWFVVAAPILALVIMALSFPTENSIANWLDFYSRRADEGQQQR